MRTNHTFHPGAGIIIMFATVFVLFACGGTGGLAKVPATPTHSPTATTTVVATSVATLAPPPIPTPVTATPIPPPPPIPTATPLPVPAPYTHLVYNQVTLTGTDVGPVAVNCPAGQVALSGGWATGGSGTIYNSTRTANGWNVYVNHNGSELINAYAECLVNQPGAVVTQRLTQISVPAGATSQYGTSACHAGEVAVGGAFALSSSIYVNEMLPVGQSWEVNFGNSGSSSELANTYAICLQGTNTSNDPEGTATTVPTGGTGGSSATCPAGTYVSGGTFINNGGGNLYNFSPTSNGWESYISNLIGSPKIIDTGAICVHFS